jgi:tetratricopeptide (TPR) repeat protein
MDRAVAAAQAGRLDQAGEILQEGIPTAAAAVDRSSAQAHRLAALAFRLQELDHAPQARELAEQALQVCSALLEEKALVADPGRNARLLALTGRLLERAAGQRREAMEAYLLAWQLDPERQVEALRAYQALAERERVILEREAEAARGKEARR